MSESVSVRMSFEEKRRVCSLSLRENKCECQCESEENRTRVFVRANSLSLSLSLCFQYPERELNPHNHHWSQDFKSCVSTNSTIRAERIYRFVDLLIC